MYSRLGFKDAAKFQTKHFPETHPHIPISSDHVGDFLSAAENIK
jgi:hypothetical protein